MRLAGVLLERQAHAFSCLVALTWIVTTVRWAAPLIVAEMITHLVDVCVREPHRVPAGALIARRF